MKKQDHSLVNQSFGMIIALCVEYVLGLYTAAFVKFPEGAPKDSLWNFAFTQLPLILHIVLSILIVLGAIALIVKALQIKNTLFIISSIIGFLAILSASSTGSSFVSTQKEIYAFFMGVSFAVAVVTYLIGMYKSFPASDNSSK